MRIITTPVRAAPANAIAERKIAALNDLVAGAVRLLCGRSGHADVVNVSVVLCARQRVTSDPEGLRAVDDALTLHVP